MKESNDTETACVTQNEFLVGTAPAPVVRYKKEREAVKEHKNKGEKTEPDVEFPDFSPHICM
jgi:hypothetical protein